LVRRATPAGERDVTALLAMDPEQVADLMRHHRVLVLSDLTRPLTAPPIAAAAFRVDPTARAAQLIRIGVAVSVRDHGLGLRLLTGALNWLRADGFELVRAGTAPGGVRASLLTAAGFTPVDGSAGDDAPSRLKLLL